MNIDKNFPCNSNNYGEKRSVENIKYIVIHYTGNKNDKAISNCKYFQSPNRNASAHYFVDETSIYQSVSDDIIAWSVGAKTYYHKECRNSNSISIEMCNSVSSVSEKARDNVRELVIYLMKKYNIPKTNVIRHYDVTHKICPASLIDNTKWNEFKNYIVSNDDNTYISAVNKLVSKDIINSPDIWLNDKFTIDNVHSLIKKMANKF